MLRSVIQSGKKTASKAVAPILLAGALAESKVEAGLVSFNVMRMSAIQSTMARTE
jgi:hypothetical protein